MKTKVRLTRRSLLKKLAGAAAASVAAPYIVPASALGAGGQLPPSERITLGIIGTGGRAGAFLGKTPILAVCDVDRTRREKARDRIASRNPGVKAYGDFREVLARDDIDAVVVTTPDHWHCQVAAMAARAGKDVYCEKPLSCNVAESRALVKVIRRQGTVLQVGSQQRSGGHFRFACELVRNGYIGQV
ncbi:MAG: Gfo/Idh/MocA family oxidoreductase, partial [Planctomycetes bacterium]|nr:Gfo/Idh/MocA family oxidoreductase [Planctomycetota bacterium]